MSSLYKEIAIREAWKKKKKKAGLKVVQLNSSEN